MTCPDSFGAGLVYACRTNLANTSNGIRNAVAFWGTPNARALQLVQVARVNSVLQALGALSAVDN